MISRIVAPSLLALSIATGPALAEEPGNIALVLPLKGRMANAATAVRDGFLAAYYQDLEQHKPSPIVRIYDNGDGQALKLVHTAVADGAQAIVGPLNKEQVTELATAGVPPVPVLALNRSEISAPNIYQFALAPEDEMAALAGFMHQQGLEHVRILSQEDPSSQRNRQAFEAAWKAAGGAPATPLVLESGAKGGVAKAIKQFVAGGETQGIDAIFLASPQLATQVRPSFNYYGARQLPVYTLSTAYDASQNDTQRLDLNGVRFCDAPWIVKGGWPGQDDLYEAAGRPASNFDRLYAFGGDAYGLINAVYENHGEVTLDGRSGRLNVNGDGRVRRELSCVEVKDGHTEVLAAPGGVAAPASGT